MKLERSSLRPRRQLAVVRMILDELERALVGADESVQLDLHGQLADELEALARHVRTLGSPVVTGLRAR